MSKIAVKCSTSLEKRNVVEFARKGKDLYTPPDYDDCVDLGDGRHQKESYYKQEGYEVISYSQFERDYLGIRGSSENSTSSNTLSELPEKWFVCPKTEENLKLIKRYFRGFNSYIITHEENSYDYTGRYSTDKKSPIQKGYTEITFDQFKKWVLKEGTQKVEEAPNPQTTETWQPKVGEWVMIKEKYLPVTSSNWLGEGGGVTHQGPFIVEEMSGNMLFVTKMSGIKVMLGRDERFRKALPHEIPMNTPTNLLEEAKRRYPVGCKFRCLVTLTEYTIPKSVAFKEENGAIYSYVDGVIFHKHYDKEKWAEVISKPTEHPEYVECISRGTDVTIGKVYRVIKHTEKSITINGDTSENTWDWPVDTLKPATREMFEKQERGLGGSRDFSGTSGSVYVGSGSSNSVGLTPSEYITRYQQTASPRYVSGYDPFGIKFAEPVEIRFDGGNIFYKKSGENLLKPQPSPKILVKSHEEFKITVNKPKQIKL